MRGSIGESQKDISKIGLFQTYLMLNSLHKGLLNVFMYT